MLPNVRLLIAAMLASVMVLICGFAIFAAFRVSREPIAHLPVAVAPLRWLIVRARHDGTVKPMRHLHSVEPVGSAFTGYRFPPEIIILAVRWYLRYGLS